MNNPLFRPPAEADSLILQIDEGCPYNHCTFCGMYRGLKYRQRPLTEVSTLIAREARHAPDTRRLFLADGDVMRRSFADLHDILTQLATHFPSLARINTYATGNAILSKTPEQLEALRALKLQILYLGLESGDDETLRRVKKAETAAVMIEAGCRAQTAGLRLSVMILLGLGGAARTREHALATADALNRMQPRLLSALRVIPVPGTEFHAETTSGRFQQLTEWEVVRELRLIVEHLDLSNTVFRANHSSNVIPLEARLPRDKAMLLEHLDSLLASNQLDPHSPGPLPRWL
jgi:radical SAM superfamily enzyme YgiQ (UPF0313 family)